MTIVKLQGGLGNQLFQYAAGRALAVRIGASLKLDARSLRTPRAYALWPYRINVRFAGLLDRPASSYRGRRQVVCRGLSALARSLVPWNLTLVTEQYQDEPEIISPGGGRTYLLGFWQNERYFAGAEAEIRSELTLKRPPSERDALLAAEMATCDSLSIHVRRGDYAMDPQVRARFGVCEWDYYGSALGRVSEKARVERIYVFSDDPVAAHRELPGLPPSTRFVDHHHSLAEAHLDLWLMQQCKYHVIANSTFSWWGAWLCTRPGKLVVAPRAWWRGPEAHLATPPVACPGDWILL